MRAALNAFLRANEARSYELGGWDCALFTFGAVLAQTGTDHIAAYRGKYTTHQEATRLMKEIDRVPTVRKLMTAKLGEPIPAAMAHTGDVVACDNQFGVLYGDRGIFLAETSGYERVPRARLEKAWRVKG